MLFSATALKLPSLSGVVGWLVRGGVDPLLIGSVPHRLNTKAAVAALLNAKPDRLDGGTESILRYRCLNGHHVPGSFSRLLGPLLTSHGLTPVRFEGLLERQSGPPCPLRSHSPGNCTLLHRTAAEFTSTGIPIAFGVWCHLNAPCRPFIRFLSISSQVLTPLRSVRAGSLRIFRVAAIAALRALS